MTIVLASGATVSRFNGFAYVDPANLTAVSPSSGQWGTRVSLVGTDLLMGGTAIANASLAGVDVDEVVSSTDTLVVLRAGQRANATATPGDVVLRADTGGHATFSSSFSYHTPSALTSVSPTSGQRGTLVTLRGSGLAGPLGTDAAAAVAFGSSEADRV